MNPKQLLQHHDSGQPWPDTVATDAFGDVTEAYQTALAVRALRCARGEQPRGYKIGFTNRTIWARYGVWAPVWGTVWGGSLSFCDDGVVELPLAGLCQPRLEPEAVFGFKATPVPGATLQDLFDAIEWVAPGFEIVQSHRPGWRFTAPETVADSALHARLLVGPRQPLFDRAGMAGMAGMAGDALALHAALAAARVVLHRDATAVEEGTGAHVLGSPLQALLHFLTELRQCPGATDLQPGDVVTTGTWTDAWPVQPGETWRADFGAPLTPLQVRFA